MSICQRCGFTPPSQRTLTQNAALHLWFTMLAHDLNAAGLDMRKVMKPEVDIPWTPETVKEQMWKPVQEAYLGTDSTTQLSKMQVGEVFDVLARYLADKHGVTVPPFPDRHQL